MVTVMSAADVGAISKVLCRIRRDNRPLIRVGKSTCCHVAVMVGQSNGKRKSYHLFILKFNG